MGFGKFDKDEPQQDNTAHLTCKARNCPNRAPARTGGVC